VTASARTTSSNGQQVWIRGIPTARLVAQVRRMAQSSAGRRQGVAQWALLSSALSPVLLVTGWLVAGAVQPDSYSPVRQTVSVLAGHGGSHRWIMTSALVAVGGCHLVTAAGFTALRPAARIGLVVSGLAAFGVAANPEPARGSTSQHLAFTVIGALAIAVWPVFVAGPEWPGWGPLSIRGNGLATIAFVTLLIWLAIETRDVGHLGLAERVSSAIQTTWPFVVALAARRATTALDEMAVDYQVAAT
jgi:hypothetical membrane protein